MKNKQILTTRDIENMTLEKFMVYEPDRYGTYTGPELMDANNEWLIYDAFSRIKTLREFRKRLRRFKEDIWWQVDFEKQSENEIIASRGTLNP